MKSCDKSMKLNTMSVFAAICAAALVPNALLAEKTTNVFTRTSSQAASLTWKASGVPNDYGTSTGLDVSLKIDYEEGAEKFQQLELPQAPLYFDSVVGGDYHSLLITNSIRKYIRINDPTPFNGFWAMKASAGPSKDVGLYLPDNGGAGVRTIGSAFLRGRFNIAVAQGCEAFFEYPFGLGAFAVNRSMNSVSTAKGKLTVSGSPGPYSIAHVHTGTLGIVGGDDDISSPVPGAWVRFDASDEDSFTMSGTAITEWRDAGGGPVSAVKDGNSSPTLYTDPETGKKAVNFGAFVNYAGSTAGDKTLHGSGARLALSETRSDVAEMFVVFKDNDLKEGTYPQIVGEAFPRRTGYSDANKLFKPREDLPAGLTMGEFRLDGQAVVPDIYYDFSRRMNVVSASYNHGGGEVIFLASPNNDGHSNLTKGGIKIAEIILYTNKLTSAQRRHNNDYLMKKWLGHSVRDYGTIMLEKPASLSVESGTARVRELNLATNGFVKAGAGTLEIESLTTHLNGLAVNGGGVRFTSTLSRPTDPQPAADALAWFDASDGDSLKTVVSNYNDTSYTFVTNWFDKRNNGYTLHSPRLGFSASYSIFAGNKKTGDEPGWPTLDESTGAHPMVDLGPWVNPCASPYKGNYGWINGNSGLSTWLCLYKPDGGMYGSFAVREGFVVFYKTDSRGNPINSTDWALRNAGGDHPQTKFLHEDHAAGAAIGGRWTYDGVTVNPVDVRGGLYANGKTHLGAFQISEAGVPANVFGSDQSGGNSAGGCKIAEIILYTRFLTEQERLDTERYLMAKWNCGTHPADKAPTVGTMTFNNGTQAVIDTDFDMTIGTVAGSGTVVKRGTGTATVGTFAQNVSSLSLEGGSLAVGSDMTLADGAALDVYFDESTNVVGTAAITGTLTVGSSATVRLHVPEGVQLGFGEYDIMTATSVSASGARWTVDDTGVAQKGMVKARLDSSRTAIVLSVGHKGLLILIR